MHVLSWRPKSECFANLISHFLHLRVVPSEVRHQTPAPPSGRCCVPGRFLLLIAACRPVEKLPAKASTRIQRGGPGILRWPGCAASWRRRARGQQARPGNAISTSRTRRLGQLGTARLASTEFRRRSRKIERARSLARRTIKSTTCLVSQKAAAGGRRKRHRVAKGDRD